ncbi:MAG TPA: glycoside hydrolase family 3 N-terminal domain-containing protein [Gemmatimonadales bacterium]|nr:glycoside hydrolase family 3 N-terminal domain-containing protein [Gemmatimonadales bacterium]
MSHARLATFTVVLLACAASTPPAPHPAPVSALPSPIVLEPRTTTDRVDRLLDSLPLRAKVAQLVMPWIPGTYAAADDPGFVKARAWVDSLEVGGIIASIGSPLDIAAKLNVLQQSAPIPLLIASDLEGGTAMRFNGGTAFPTNMGVAATGRELDAYEMGRITALEGRAVGIHLDFAPVADVNNNAANPIINTRSFGENPDAVAMLVSAEIRGLQEHGMLATAKHFPGHGDTGTDSHIALPVVDQPWTRLDSVELVPFRAAIKSRVAAVMSAHIALPGIDSGRVRPATLTPSLLTGLLRDSLGFDGLVVTDALDMGAVVKEYGVGEAAVLALLAGADLLLQPADPGAAIDAVVAAVEQGRVTQARLDASVRRVLELKRRLGLFKRRTVPLDGVMDAVGTAEHQLIARDVTARSLVLVRDSGGVVTRLRSGPQPVSLLTYADDPASGLGATLGNELRAAGYQVTSFRLWPSSGPASLDSARVALAASPIALVAASVRVSAWRGTISLPTDVAALVDSSARVRPTVLVSFGSPYLLSQTPAVQGYLLAWAARPINEQAVAAALRGTADISGRLPITLDSANAIGGGLQVRASR